MRKQLRTLKFRVWDNDPQVQQMFYSKGLDQVLFGGSEDDIRLGIQLHWSVKNSFSGWHRDRHFRTELREGVLVMEQFTGFTDKNGKEVYEGDLVKVGGLVETVSYIGGILCCYSQEIYGKHDKVTIDNFENLVVTCFDYFEPYEIIGNIHTL